MNPIIQSERLDLIPLTPAVLRAVLAGNDSEAGELLGIATPADWAISRHAMELRLSQLEANPGLQPWLLRRKVDGPEHPDTFSAMHNLTSSYFDAGRREEAPKMREDVLTFSRKVTLPAFD